jgi:uncharacterized protein (DUF302 family)
MRIHPLFLAGLLLSGGAGAQTPAPQLSQEQAQQMMARQMQMMAAMFDYRRSRLDFDATVAAIGAAAERRGWHKGPVQDVQASPGQSGAASGTAMKVITTCPNRFNDKLAEASDGKLPPHPCRFTVFKGRDGKTYVVRMNSALLAKGIQGEAGKLMAAIGADEEAILKGIAE